LRAVRDSFLQFLADNSVTYPVRNLRKDPDNPKLSQIQEGAVNVQFIVDDPSVQVSDVTVNIDVVSTAELTAIDMMRAMWNLLSASAMTPLFDYTVPASPIRQQGNVFWNPEKVRFRPVASDLYFRYSCTLTLSYHIQ
jgi:hypothetical protein